MSVCLLKELEIMCTEACYESTQKIILLLNNHPLLSHYNLSIDTYDMECTLCWCSSRTYLSIYQDGNFDISCYILQNKVHSISYPSNTHLNIIIQELEKYVK